MPKKKKNKLNICRQQHPGFREMPAEFADRNMETLNTADRSIDYVMTTENPVSVFDWKRWEVIEEVLLMDGLIDMPAQVPLLDSHNYGSTKHQYGSTDNIRIEDNLLIGRAVYSANKNADEAFTLVREGHLKTVSIGYAVFTAIYLETDQTEIINGREFEGPLKVVTKWQLKELSNTTMPADENAVARSQSHLFFNNPSKEEPTMKKKVTKKKANAADDDNGRQDVDDEPESTPPAPANTTAEERQAILDEGARAERTRTLGIRNMYQSCGMQERADEVIDAVPVVSIDEARSKLIEFIAKRDKEKTPAHRNADMEVGTSSREKFMVQAEGALCLRAGFEVEKPELITDLRGFSLTELARESLRTAGADYSGSKLEMVGRALSTDDFSNILANVANKSLLDGFDTAEETWGMWCGEGQTSDFKTLDIDDTSQFTDLDEVKELGEYTHGEITDNKEQTQLVTYGKLFGISRVVIINDDLSALLSAPAKMGLAAARKIGDVAYAVLTANADMGDGNALFDQTNHSNLRTDAGLTGAKIGNSVKQMKLQKDINSVASLNIRPIYFIAPVATEFAAEQFFAPVNANVQSSSNPYEGAYFTRVYEPRLDDASTIIYYLAAAKGKTVVLYFLNGNKKPFLERKVGFNQDGIVHKVRIDVAAKAVSHRGLQSNTSGS